MLSIIGAKFPKDAKCDPDLIIKAAEEFSKKNNCAIQILDASMIVGREHLNSAILHAQRAFENKTNAARSLPVEIARFASGERQISAALSKIGISEKTKTLAIVAIGNCSLGDLLENIGAERDDSVIDAAPGKLKKWRIKEKEEILGRVALVEIL